MKVLLIVLSIFSLFIASCSHDGSIDSVDPVNPVDFVDPFIGTDAHGHTYPGASMPFGMVQLTPNTRIEGWDGVSGYHYTDSTILGFSHTALSGTGVGDYNDILIMPVVGDPVLSNTEYQSPFRKETEDAGAGYYKVFLDKPGVLAELTATTRVGHHRYTFPASEQANFIIDLVHRDKVVDAWIEIVSDTEIRGMRRSTNWAKDLVWYFHMEFSKPFVRSGIAIDDLIQDGMTRAQGTHIKAFVGFETASDESIEVKVSLSSVDADGAKANMVAELPDWGFDGTRQQAYDTWNEALKKIRVRGGTSDQTTVFYTALYRTFLQPNTFNDVDGRFRGMDREVHQSDGDTRYTVFSLWDTYRAWHPLMTIIDTTRTAEMIRTMLDMYDMGGLLPIWELGGNETYTMIGNHAISVITDAYLKGIRGFDTEKALQAMIHSATRDHYGLDAYITYGHIPGEKEHESISKTLEYAYNDWNVAMMAKAMGHDDVYREYIRRAQFYKNIFDPATGFMRPRINGGWLEPFDPTTVDWHFTEANSWHYSFYVPQDISGFAEMHGGKDRLAAKIEELFTTNAPITGRDMKDITGMIGQYAQGNEPSHHMAYLFNYVNQPWRTQHYVRRIMDNLYTAAPDGLSGNEDCGQMSAWLVLSAMGFYPVSPGQPDYAIGTPWFPEVEIFLENGNSLKIFAEDVSKNNYYIQSASLNDAEYSKSWISHADILNGGELRFVMGGSPNTSWGSRDEDVPVTAITDELLLPVPWVEANDYRIRDSIEVRLGHQTQREEIYYTTDGSDPSRASTQYKGPFYLYDTSILNAAAWHPELGYSYAVEANFVKIDGRRSIQINSIPHQNYHGDGPDALIDGIRGQDNWRLGGWQGYQGTDFEAIVDLGEVMDIGHLSAGFTQDTRSWILMPTTVTFSVSDDGQQWKTVLSPSHQVAPDDYDIQQHDLGGAVQARGRYVKINAVHFGKLPSWHLGAGGDAYIFIDEIVVR